MNKALIAIAIALLAGIGNAQANDDTRKTHGHHMHGPLHGDVHRSSGMAAMPGAFLEHRRIDGFDVSFHVMRATDKILHGGSSNLMVKVERNGAVQELAVVNSKVVAPGGAAESKMMMKMGDWYMASYDLDGEGSYQLMVLFKTPDGKKHFGGVYFPDVGDGQQH